MEKEKIKTLEKAGFKNYTDLIKENKCPFCGNEINMDDFKDELSLKEFEISGLCMDCQNSTFGDL